MPKIIAPAKNITMLQNVIEAGAGMIYTGVKGYCRKDKDGIDFDALKQFSEICREKNVKLIAAFNRLPALNELPSFFEVMEISIKSGIDGVILNDNGIIRETRKLFPKLYIMASIGMSPLNWREVNFIAENGADTVLLSEFMDSDEVKVIHEKCKVGLEFFALGLKEFGYTGKCILSSYHKQFYREEKIKGSAKRGGTCWDVCRGKFEAKGTVTGKSNLRFERFDIDKKLRQLLPYIDVFKFIQGPLKTNELCDIIRLYKSKL